MVNLYCLLILRRKLSTVLKLISSVGVVLAIQSYIYTIGLQLVKALCLYII
jgi:hypothetical protein